MTCISPWLRIWKGLVEVNFSDVRLKTGARVRCEERMRVLLQNTLGFESPSGCQVPLQILDERLEFQ